jgi:hypothetical protein
VIVMWGMLTSLLNMLEKKNKGRSWWGILLNNGNEHEV